MACPPLRGYVIAASPRTGSWLLCHALEDSGIAGAPAEYFWAGDQPAWRQRWGISRTFRDYVEGFWTTASGNRMVGAKIMWAYFFDFLGQARAVPEWAWMDHDKLMESIFPDLRYLWISRRDKVRQGISWWRAEATGQWAVAKGHRAGPAPGKLDLAAAKNLVEVAHVHDVAWAEYFNQRGIEPWHVFYEDLVKDLRCATVSALDHLGLDSSGVKSPQPRIERQADEQTERWVEEYLAAQESGRLDEVAPAARPPVLEDPASAQARQEDVPRAVGFR